ncbi:MAG: hypothetical protein WAQ41_09130 [bacterium]|nr:hypothetical protein [Bacillota bacterium]
MAGVFVLLEELNPQFAAALRRRVDLAELTIISLQLTPRQAVVVTNRRIYFLRKGILGIGVRVTPLEEVRFLRVVGEVLLLEGKGGRLGRIEFGGRRELQGKVYKRLQALIGG